MGLKVQDEGLGLWPTHSSPTSPRSGPGSGGGSATMVGAELGILCFFESRLQEQCRFLWVSPRQPSTSPAALAALLFLLETHCWGREVGIWGGSPSLERMARLD